jgi:hypothetical protein
MGSHGSVPRCVCIARRHMRTPPNPELPHATQGSCPAQQAHPAAPCLGTTSWQLLRAPLLLAAAASNAPAASAPHTPHVPLWRHQGQQQTQCAVAPLPRCLSNCLMMPMDSTLQHTAAAAVHPRQLLCDHRPLPQHLQPVPLDLLAGDSSALPTHTRGEGAEPSPPPAPQCLATCWLVAAAAQHSDTAPTLLLLPLLSACRSA